MKSTSFIAASVLASVAIAQPHRQHQAFHHRRDSPPVVWTTEWDVVTETVDVTTTVWVSEGYVPPTSSASSSPATASALETPVPAQFFEPAASPSTSSSSSVYVAPPPPASTSVPPTSVAAPTPAYVAPVQSSSSVAPPVAAPAPEPVTSTSPVYVAPTPTTPAYVAPVQSSTPVAAPTTSASSGGGSSGGVCSESSPCTGDITHYDTGMGACGWPNVSTDKVIALPHVLMGTQSNGNPYCGKTVTISLNGKTTQAEVVDKCMGCDGDSIDLSDGAFEDLADMGLGRVHDVKWWFN